MDNLKEITKSCLAVIIALSAIVSLFISVNEVGARILQTFAGVIIGYYFGASMLPFAKISSNKKVLDKE